MSNQTQTNPIQSSNKTTHITAKSEVSQLTAISDRPKAKPKNSRKLQQQQKQSQSETIVSIPFSSRSIGEFIRSSIVDSSDNVTR